MLQVFMITLNILPARKVLGKLSQYLIIKDSSWS